MIQSSNGQIRKKMSFNKKIIKFLRRWLPTAVVVVAMSVLVYLCMQQLLRQSANDPQVQMAEDAAFALAAGKPATEVVPVNQVEISSSLAPFLMVFDDTGKLLNSNALLDGQMPRYPTGVFEYVRQHGQDRVTWQPRSGVRLATVATQFKGPSSSGFVVAGRSLRESENRSDYFLMFTSAAGLITLVVTAAINWFFLNYPKRETLGPDKKKKTQHHT
jgi:hypothetical protein